MSIFSNIHIEGLTPLEAVTGTKPIPTLPQVIEGMTHSITPTLLNAFLYFQGASEKWKESAEESMMNTLGKIFVSNPAMSKGVEFEDLICKITEGKSFESLEIKHLEEFNKDTLKEIVITLGDIVAEGDWQVAVKTPFKSKTGEIFQLSSKFDVLKPEIIYDIKYTGKKRADKFKNSVQHRIYMYQTGISKFAYLVSDCKKWWREDYYRDSLNDGHYIDSIICDFLAWLDSKPEAKELYREKWKVKTQ